MTTQPAVLVVEHEAAVAQVLATLCQEQGWSCTPAPDVSGALASARKSRPDAVLLDVNLPSGGAMITLRRLRAGVETATTPVLLLGTNAATPAAVFLAAGASGHVRDAADMEAVRQQLRQALGADVPAPAAAPAEVLEHPLRMAALRASGLLDSDPEAAFDRVTRLAGRLLGMPTALLSVIDRDRQFFKSEVGLPEPWATARETPLTHSFCQWVVSGREPVLVSDAREHRVLRHNKAIHDIGVVAYAGVPVHSLEGEALGALCAIDAEPRTWNEADEVDLRDLARVAEASIAHAALVRQPPQRQEDLDHYIEACGGAVTGAVSLLRRAGPRLGEAERLDLLALVDEHAGHLVQLNRLIQVNQALN